MLTLEPDRLDTQICGPANLELDSTDLACLL